MKDLAYNEHVLEKYLDQKIQVTAIYERFVHDSETGKLFKYILLADVRNIGGELLRNHIWSSEIPAFIIDGNLDKGTIVKFEGIVSTYSKGINSENIDYTLKNISNVKIVGHRQGSRENCDSCEHKTNADGLKYRIEACEKKLSEQINKELITKKNISELKSIIKELENRNKDISSIRRSLTMKNIHLKNVMEELYNISQRSNIRNVERLKQRMSQLIGDAITCPHCERKLNNCICR